MYYPDAGNAINTKILKALGLEYIRFHDLSTLSPLWRCKAARTYALSRKCWVMPTKASPYAPTPIPSTPCKSKPPKPSAVLWRRTCRRAGSPLRNKKPGKRVTNHETIFVFCQRLFRGYSRDISEISTFNQNGLLAWIGFLWRKRLTHEKVVTQLRNLPCSSPVNSAMLFSFFVQSLFCSLQFRTFSTITQLGHQLTEFGIILLGIV